MRATHLKLKNTNGNLLHLVRFIQCFLVSLLDAFPAPIVCLSCPFTFIFAASVSSSSLPPCFVPELSCLPLCTCVAARFAERTSATLRADLDEAALRAEAAHRRALDAAAALDEHCAQNRRDVDELQRQWAQASADRDRALQDEISAFSPLGLICD
jgi:hypothetical protein